MIVKKETLDRLREMATSPDRVAMNRRQMIPTPGAKLIDTEQDLERTRAALREALAIIDLIQAEESHAT
jgi:hypothetical protein